MTKRKPAIRAASNFVIWFEPVTGGETSKVVLGIDALTHNPYFTLAEYRRRNDERVPYSERQKVFAGVLEILTDQLGHDDARLLAFLTD